MSAAGEPVYTAYFRDPESNVAMHVASTFDKVIAWCESQREETNFEVVRFNASPDWHFAIMCDVVDSTDVASGSMIAKFNPDGSVEDWREDAREKGYVT